MRHLRTTVFPMVCVFALILVGCASGDRDTPKATVLTMVAALRRGDKETFLECFVAGDTGETAERIAAVADAAVASRKLRERYHERFGETIWNAVAGMEIEPAWSHLKVDRMTFRIDGDSATATMPAGDDTMRLVRSDGTWKITDDGLPAGDDMQQTVDELRRLTRALERACERIAGPTVRKEDVPGIVNFALQQAAQE